MFIKSGPETKQTSKSKQTAAFMDRLWTYLK